VDAIDTYGRTALHLAAMCNVCEAIQLLLDAGADVGISDLDGNTPLHLAFAFSASAAVGVLENHLDHRTQNQATEDVPDLYNVPNIYGRSPLECAGSGPSKYSSIFSRY
jgi:ankyrin repeat protein